MESGTQTTLEEWMPQACPEQTCGALDSHARTLASQENKKDLKETAAVYFLQLQDFLGQSKKKIDPSIYSSRMLRIFFLLIEDMTLPDFSLSWTKSGMMRNGKFSTRKTSEYRKTGSGCSLLDILEDEVPEKYFLSEKQAEYITRPEKSCKPVEITPTLTARGPSRGRGNNSPVPGVKYLNIKDQSGKERSQQDRIYSTDGIMTALNSQLGGRHNIAIPALTAQDRHGVVVKEATKKGYALATTGDSINLEQPNSKTRRGRVGKGVAQTLTTGCKQGTLDGTRIRRLTPKECFRLQGWEDEYFKRAAMVNSDSQIYKQAGNGVTVPVIETIAKQLNCYLN